MCPRVNGHFQGVRGLCCVAVRGIFTLGSTGVQTLIPMNHRKSHTLSVVWQNAFGRTLRDALFDVARAIRAGVIRFSLVLFVLSFLLGLSPGQPASALEGAYSNY